MRAGALSRFAVLTFLSLVGRLPAAAADAPEQPAVPREWLTPAEADGFRSTPSYDETLAFLKRLQARFPEMSLRFYGSSGEGRPLPLVIVSKEKEFSPERENDRDSDGHGVEAPRKPVILIQNGIHAGEIDGKDACLMILRDLALGRRRELLDAATLLILPIYNVDGHERVSPYNRPNQDGPVAGMGFRTTTAGLDLNRDYLKLVSLEARSLAALVNAWRPDLHVDDHVTDGVDHDWVLTWSWAEAPQAPAPVDRWLKAHLPAVLAATAAAGHRNGPYVDLKDRNDPGKGFSSWVGQPRYSTGYFPLRNRPSILVETHSYKPYKARVLANRDFLVALIREVGRDPQALTRAVREAEEETVARGRAGAPPSQVAVIYEESDAAEPLRLPLYATHLAPSLVSGQPLLTYERGKVREIEVPWYHLAKATMSLPRPRGYLVLPGWPQIEERLRGHGLTVRRLTAAAELDVEAARLAPPDLAKSTYQGLTQVTAKVSRRSERRRIPAGALWVPADQPDFEVAVQLLEPEAPDSLLSWGLLSTLFEQKEFMAPQVLEGSAEKMIADPQVAAEWKAALADQAFAKDPRARYAWWFERTPYADETIRLLPVFRVMTAPDLATQPWR